MRLNQKQKEEQLERLWEITANAYTGAQLPTRLFFEQCVKSGDVFVEWTNNYICQNPRIIGYALVSDDWGDRPIPLLRSIAVVKHLRGNGVASRLLAEIADYYSSIDCRAIILHCKVDNPAQTLYFKHGYRVTHVLRRYYQQEGDGLEMRKEL
jgi:ribosomal protein S18 acetylase RimI-like enzyme